MPAAMMIRGGAGWLQLAAVLVVAVLAKEYLSLRRLLQDARLSGICESCPTGGEPQEALRRKLEKVQHQQHKAAAQQQESLAAADVIKREGSAAWCHGTDYSDRLCRFRNLCYLPAPAVYVFFHHPHKSVLSGIPDDRYSPSLADLSTVRHHNRQLFNYVDVPAESADQVLSGALMINHTSLLLKRFNPDNLMHVLHDDLLPLYHTLLGIGGYRGNDNNADSSFDVQLVLMEGWESGPYIELYQLFTAYKPLLLRDIELAKRPICFQDVYVGLTKRTTWYQYGFHEPQGPIPESPVTAMEIRLFTQFVRQKYSLKEKNSQFVESKNYGIVKPEALESNTIVIFTRRYNRLILNEVELTTALAQRLQMKVVTLSMETHSIQDIIAVLSQTTVLISMHGSLLSLAMFLSPGAVLLELFPYAINPAHYTPYKTLAELAGMGILYRAWRNSRLENTVTHPERTWDTGGIAHLPADEQRRIVASVDVPIHLCCRDPEWLFRIYQDTVVDIDELVVVIKNQLMERDLRFGSLVEEQHALVCDKISPSWVQNITCSKGFLEDETDAAKLRVSWEVPWNLEFLDAETVEYEVWLQLSGHTDYSAYIMAKTEHVFDTGLSKGVEYFVWVRCLLDSDIVGPFNIEQIVCVP